MDFVPYEKIGDFKFGEIIQNMFSSIDLTKNTDILSSKYYVEDKGIMYRFDSGLFTQMVLDLQFYKSRILFLNKDLTKKTEIDSIIENEEIIERKGYWVFPKLGLAISKDKEELYFFDESLLKNWKLINRPITSW